MIDAEIERLRELCAKVHYPVYDCPFKTAMPAILDALVETRKALRHCVRDHEINNNFHIAQCAACRLVADMPATC